MPLGFWNLGFRFRDFPFHRQGGLAQLARAPALHAGGRRFDSDILHIPRPFPERATVAERKIIDILGRRTAMYGEGKRNTNLVAATGGRVIRE